MNFAVYSKKGGLLTILTKENWCSASSGIYTLMEGCGGCQGCLLLQSEHRGLRILPIKTMDEVYGDGSDCLCCPKCGLCIEHGDCETEYGCGEANVNAPTISSDTHTD